MLQRFAVAELPAAPWKNGGGSTLELARWPLGATLDGFDWRVSIATIAASGPFSVFPGIDRSILLIEGDGVRLRSADALIDECLGRPLVPFSFPGEAALDCELLGAASSDLNVMVRRDRVAAEVQVVRRRVEFDQAPQGLLLALRGDWTLALHGAAEEGARRHRLSANEGLWWSDAEGNVRLQGAGADAALVAVLFKPKNLYSSA